MVCDVGNNGFYADTALRQAIEQGWIPGPTIINSGIIIGGMGGQFFPTPEMAKQHNIVYPEYLDADTPDEMRARLALCALTASVLAQGLALLGIESPDQM